MAYGITNWVEDRLKYKYDSGEGPRNIKEAKKEEGIDSLFQSELIAGTGIWHLLELLVAYRYKEGDNDEL